ncbi:MAG: integrin alpha, partial [Thermodesulfobacteriota bacterium]
FANATHIENLPTPLRSGEPQFFLLPRLDVTGTIPFFFTLDVRDEVGNNSGPSNVPPNVTTPLVTLEFENNTDGSCFAESIGSGDFNGDFITDIIVGDPCLGIAYIFFGSTELIAGIFDASSPGVADVTIIGDPVDSFAATVAGIDSFGGGVSDEIAIGAPGSNGEPGEVFIIFGNPNLPSVIDCTIDCTQGDVSGRLITGENPGDEFGTSIESLFGVEGGSTIWVLIGAPGANSETGEAYLFRANRIQELTPASEAEAIFNGQVPGGMFGLTLTQLGDINNDSFSEFVVGAPEAGQVFVIFGSRDISPDTPMVIINGNTADGFASSISGGADVDGDGLPDLLVGAPKTNMNTGSVCLYSGTDIAMAPSTGVSPETEFTGETAGDMFGASVSVLGDLNPVVSEEKRPSFFVLLLIFNNPDFVIGAPETIEGGSVYVFFGRDEEFPTSVPATDSDLPPINGMNPDEDFGRIVLSIGDISGDFIADIGVGGGVDELGFVRAEY